MYPRQDIADVSVLPQEAGGLTKRRSGHNIDLCQTMEILETEQLESLKAECGEGEMVVRKHARRNKLSGRQGRRLRPG